MSRKVAIAILLSIILFTGISTYLASQLQFNYDFDHFFPQNDPDLDHFLEYRKNYENDNDHILIAIENTSSIFNTAFLKEVDQFTKEIEELDHVESVLSPTNIKQAVFNAFGYMEIPLLHVYDRLKLKKDSLRVSRSPEYLNTFFSEDFNSVCLVVNNTQFISKEASDELLLEIEKLISTHTFDDVHYAGKVRGQSTYLGIMKKEFVLFFLCSVVLIILLLSLSFRSIFGVVVPIITVLAAIVGVLGLMHFSGKSLDIMSTLLPSILFVVGMSDVVHILNKYIEELRNGSKKQSAIKSTFKEIGTATLLTSTTTAIGFSTLIMIPIYPIQNFAIYAAIGVILAFIIAILLLPAILSLVKTPKIASRKSNGILWNRMLQKGFLFSVKHPKQIIVTYVFLVVLSIVGIMQLEVNTFLLEDLSEDNPLQQDFRFFEKHYSGVRPFEMSIALKGEARVFDFAVMQEMDKIEAYLYTDYQVGFIWSPVSLIKIANKAMHNGNSAYYRIPKTEKDYKKLMRKLRKANLEKQTANMVTKDQRECRFTGKMDDLGSNKVAKLNEAFEGFFQAEIDANVVDYKMTGTSMLIDKNNRFLAKNMIGSLGVAFLLIALTLGGLFKSIKIGLISLIPNIIPLTFIGGIMGYFNTNINMSVSIVFTIAFGIAVDDTIHFFSKLKLEQRKKKSFLYALKRTYLSAGKAIVLTSIILCGGFLSLILSDFKSTFLIGLYISLTLLLAVITDLLLLPALLVVLRQKNKPLQVGH